MNQLNHIQKYGFNFEWFLDVYNEINYLNISDLDNKSLNIIESCYRNNYLNYHDFIKIILEKFKMIDDINIYLSQEKKCLICQNNYPFSLDCFITFYDKNKSDITKCMCVDCIQYYTSEDIEPYQKIYLDFES